MNAARRTMRHVDVFSWLSTQRQRASTRLVELKQVRTNNEYDAVTAALDVARQAARLEQLDDLLSQLQDG